MEFVGIVLLCLLTWGECIAVEEATYLEEGCTVHHLTGKVGVSSSPSFLLSPLFPIAIRSPYQPWQDFSFAIKNSTEFPVGSLKVSRAGEITELSLAAMSKNVNTSDQEQLQQTVQLSQEEAEHVSLRNWTFISFRVLSGQLQLSVHDGLDKLVFRDVNASEFRRAAAHVPPGHFLDVALGCTRSSQLPLNNVVSVVAATTEPPGGDSGSNTPVVVVFLVVLSLILVVGAWYWRGRRRSRRPENEAGGETEEGGRRTEEGDEREGEERAETRPLVDGSGLVVENEKDSESESESDRQQSPHETQTTTKSQNETNATGDSHNETQTTTNSQNKTNATGDSHNKTRATETSRDEAEIDSNPDSETVTTEDSPNEGEEIQGTFFATQDEIKKSTHSIYDPE